MSVSMHRQLRKSISIAILLAFISTSVNFQAYAQVSSNEQMPWMPTPGTMVSVSSSFEPALIKGLTVHQDNPFLFDFIVDPGDEKTVIPAKAGIQYKEQLRDESLRMIKYFFASLTLPDKDIWVNLSPYEKDRMIPESLGVTAMGRDLLAQDYMLKQLTASLIYPQKSLGKTFWAQVYAKAKAMYGTTQIPINTFNKVWIVPQEAGIYEHGQTAFIVSSHLKVMLEEDYLSLTKHNAISGVIARSPQGDEAISKRTTNDMHSLGSTIIRQVVLPEIEKEVNEGKNFATLRQIFYAQVLAVWFKRNLKQALLNQVYANRSMVKGIERRSSNVIPAKAGIQNQDLSPDQIYHQYLRAYKKGVFNYIQEDVDPVTQEALPRKYFSGGYSGLRYLKFHHALLSIKDWFSAKKDLLLTIFAAPGRQYATGFLSDGSMTASKKFLGVVAGAALLSPMAAATTQGTSKTKNQVKSPPPVVAKVQTQESHSIIIPGGELVGTGFKVNRTGKIIKVQAFEGLGNSETISFDKDTDNVQDSTAETGDKVSESMPLTSLWRKTVERLKSILLDAVARARPRDVDLLRKDFDDINERSNPQPLVVSNGNNGGTFSINPSDGTVKSNGPLNPTGSIETGDVLSQKDGKEIKLEPGLEQWKGFWGSVIDSLKADKNTSNNVQKNVCIAAVNAVLAKAPIRIAGKNGEPNLVIEPMLSGFKITAQDTFNGRLSSYDIDVTHTGQVTQVSGSNSGTFEPWTPQWTQILNQALDFLARAEQNSPEDAKILVGLEAQTKEILNHVPLQIVLDDGLIKLFVGQLLGGNLYVKLDLGSYDKNGEVATQSATYLIDRSSGETVTLLDKHVFTGGVNEQGSLFSMLERRLGQFLEEGSKDPDNPLSDADKTKAEGFLKSFGNLRARASISSDNGDMDVNIEKGALIVTGLNNLRYSINLQSRELSVEAVAFQAQFMNLSLDEESILMPGAQDSIWVRKVTRGIQSEYVLKSYPPSREVVAGITSDVDAYMRILEPFYAHPSVETHAPGTYTSILEEIEEAIKKKVTPDAQNQNRYNDIIKVIDVLKANNIVSLVSSSPNPLFAEPAPNGGIDLSQEDKALHIEKDSNGGVKINVDQALVARVERNGVSEIDPVFISMHPADIKSLLGSRAPI